MYLLITWIYFFSFSRTLTSLICGKLREILTFGWLRAPFKFWFIILSLFLAPSQSSNVFIFLWAQSIQFHIFQTMSFEKPKHFKEIQKFIFYIFWVWLSSYTWKTTSIIKSLWEYCLLLTKYQLMAYIKLITSASF